MKKLMMFAILTLILSGCGRYIETQELPDKSDERVYAQPINVTVNPPNISVNVSVEGDNIDNSNSTVANGGSSSSNSQGGSSSATGTGGSGGAGGTASAGNSTSSANNSSSSNSTNSSTNSGSASNQANNSTNNSADNSSNVSDSGNSTNTNSNSAEVNIDQDYDFNIELGGGENYFKKAKKDKTKVPNKCEDPQPNLNLLCHAYDFTGRSQLSSDLASAPHLGSFYMDRFDVTARNWEMGFPKFPASLAYLRENYAVRCFAKLKVTAAGVHTFSITSDDGMRVLLNNSPVLQDDGLHAPRTASATSNLSVGLYDLEIQWFQGPRTEIAAELKWKTPDNSTLRYIESSNLQKAKKLCK